MELTKGRRVRSVTKDSPNTVAYQRFGWLSLAYRPHYATLFGPRNAKTCLRTCADIGAPDQPALPRRLIRAFAVRLQNSWTLQNISMESKCQDETLGMRVMNLNLCILNMLEDTFSLGAAHL